MSQRILRQEGFIPFLITRIFAMFAMQIQAVIVAWHLYDITKDPMALAWVGLAQFIPMVLCLPISGDVADRFNRKWLLGSGLFLAGLCSITLMWIMSLGIDYLPYSYIALIGFGIARSFINPTLHSLLPQIIPKETLPQSLATSTTLMKIAVITGPVVGGFLYSWIGSWTYLVCALCFTLAILPLIGIQLKFVDSHSINSTFTLINVWRRFREGVTFIWTNRVVLGAISLDLFAVLLGGVVALLPIYASEVLNVGAEGLGILKSAMAIGEIITGIYLTRYPIRRAVGKVMFCSVALFGVANLVFAFSNIFWLSFIALMLAGVFDMISVNIRGSLIQLSTPDYMRGRVSAVNMLFISSSNELGEFRAGLSARLIGTVPTAITGGILTLVVVAIMFNKFKPLAKIDSFQEITLK